MNIDTNYQALADVMFGYAQSRAATVAQNSVKLAHYTSAENALNIISGQTMWLRNAAVMNDHSEIEHGRSILEATMGMRPLGELLLQILDSAHNGLATRITEHVQKQRGQTRNRIFMVSLSETEAADRLGRLSMWRAYGGKTSGAALIFNGEVFADAQQQLMAFASPVLYGDYEQFAPQLKAVIDNLEREPHLLCNVPIDIAFNTISTALDFAILSIKHLGFEEEREWRIIHQPFQYTSAHVKEKVTSVAGTPQLIYELPLMNCPGLNMPELSLDQLLYRVIVGPSVHPETTRQALVEALRVKGVRAPEARVVISDIPLRQTG
jgi:hypothetical protein